MDESLLVKALDTLKTLNGDHAHRLKCVLLVAKAEKLSQVRAENVDNHNVEIAFDSIVVTLGEAIYILRNE